MDLDKLKELSRQPGYALEIGKAAEHLVCCDLIAQGFGAFLTGQGMPYDVVAEVGGRLIRIQVKAACFAKNVNARGRRERIAYCWNVRRRGKGGGKRLKDDGCDVVALVALDVRRVAYVPVTACSQTVTLMLDRQPGKYGYSLGELELFTPSTRGFPEKLGTKGRKIAIRRDGTIIG